jgi:hypothetical protein
LLKAENFKTILKNKILIIGFFFLNIKLNKNIEKKQVNGKNSDLKEF